MEYPDEISYELICKEINKWKSKKINLESELAELAYLDNDDYECK